MQVYVIAFIILAICIAAIVFSLRVWKELQEMQEEEMKKRKDHPLNRRKK